MTQAETTATVRAPRRRRVRVPAGDPRWLVRGRPGTGPDGTLRRRTGELEVFVSVPDNGKWLLLSFATPLGPLVPALTKLFDAIYTTLRWDD